MKGDADTALRGVDEEALATSLLVHLDLALEDLGRVAAAVGQLHRVDAGVVLRDHAGARVQCVKRRRVRYKVGCGYDAVARLRHRAHRLEEDVLVVQVGVTADGRGAMGIVDKRERGVREARALGRRERVGGGDASLWLSAQDATHHSLPRPSLGSELGEKRAEVAIVLDHRPRDQVLGLRFAREVAQQLKRQSLVAPGHDRSCVLARVNAVAAAALGGGVRGKRGVVGGVAVDEARPCVHAAQHALLLGHRASQRLRRDDQEERDGVTSNPRVERELVVRELRREHRHRASALALLIANAAVVSGRAAASRPAKERRVRRQPRGHISHVNPENEGVDGQGTVDAVVDVGGELCRRLGQRRERESVVDVASANVVHGKHVECAAIQTATLGWLGKRAEGPRVRLRVAAWLNSEVQLVSLELGGIRADLAEKFNELGFLAANSVLDGNLGKSIALSSFVQRCVFHVDNHALTTCEEHIGRDTILAKTIAVVKLHDDIADVGPGVRHAKRS